MIRSGDAFSLKSHNISLTAMPVLRGTVLLFRLMRIMYVTSFGSLQNPQEALIGGSVIWSLLRQFWWVRLSSGPLIARRLPES